MLADNHLAELAEIDKDRLVGVLKELQAAGHDVGLAGFTEDEVPAQRSRGRNRPARTHAQDGVSFLTRIADLS